MEVSEKEQKRPLKDIRVLDLTLALAGPFATFLMAGMGAEVIKIEPPEGELARRTPPYFGARGVHFGPPQEGDMTVSMLQRGRGKKSLTLNFKNPRAREIFLQLAKVSDVVIENFSPGTVERMGVDYKKVKEVNPRIIYCSISGFGQEGPYKDLRAFDAMIQAMSGVMNVTGKPDEEPMRFGLPIADLATPLYAIIGILLALRYRDKTGKGQYIDVAMMDSLMSFIAGEQFDIFAKFGIPFKTGNFMARVAPFGIYPASDGYVAICAPADPFAFRLFELMGQKELAEDERFSSPGQRVANYSALNAIIEAWSKTKTTAELVDLLNKHGIPSGPVRKVEEALRDPYLLEKRVLIHPVHPVYGTVEDTVGTNVPIKFSECYCEVDGLPSFLGQHNEEILKGILNYSNEDIAILREQGVII